MLLNVKHGGNEFEKEKAKMELHGGQLFAYLANDHNTKYISLYASKLEEEITYTNLIIKIDDRKEDLEKSKKEIEEKNIKLYINAKNKKEFFEVWEESFNLYFHFNGIFDDDINAYSVELKPLKRKDLKELTDSAGTFKKFAEILRHNNISDNANAFNRILSLFLCKIVDEEKNYDEILGFQVKEDESYEAIQDRLQHLYQKGMKEHLKEDIVYYSEQQLKHIIDMYPKQTPLEEIIKMFRGLKYYTNNEFAFKEVHNEDLFKQNARVLNEVIKLLQNYQFKYSSKKQVLGNFFELMLTHGVKQSEGQFFTPIPIVRYIISSLNYPQFIENKINNKEKKFLPKILDYACGAGHFLTESIDEIQEILKTIDSKSINKDLIENLDDYKRSTKWAEKYIYGVDKDYRLARTSQISCFLNGDGDANIIFGDGLEENARLKLKNKKFDMVIANPPYSVDSFKNYLNVNEKQYSLYNFLTEKSSQIEVLFVERTKEVLEIGGVAGIILPNSILDKQKPYLQARELILKYFEVKGITILGKNTFIATTISTVILFLKRRDDNFLKDREYISNDLFNGIKRNNEFIDSERLINSFIEFRNLNKDDYFEFLESNVNDNLLETEIFQEYKHEFDNNNEVKKFKEQKTFKDLTKKEQQQKLFKKFYEQVKLIEKEKFLYFMLCLKKGNSLTDDNYYKSQQVTVTDVGESVDEQKEFLGYSIIKKEGLRLYNNNKLFNDENLLDTTKANFYTIQSFDDEVIKDIDENLEKNIRQISLLDMINFDSKTFDKQIKPNAQKRVKFDTLHDLVPLSKIIDENLSGVIFDKNDQITTISKNSVLTASNINLDTKSLIFEKTIYLKDSLKIKEDIRLQKNDIFICTSSGSLSHLGKSAFIKEDLNFYAGGFCSILRGKNYNIQKYISIIFNLTIQYRSFIEQFKGSNINNLKIPELLEFKIPYPKNENIIKNIVADIEKLEKDEISNNNLINNKKDEINNKINNSFFSKKALKTFATLNPSKDIKDLNDDTLVTFLDMPSVSNDGLIEKPMIKTLGMAKKGFTFFQNGDVIMAKITPSMENGKGAYIENMKNNLGFGSTEFHTIRPIENKSLGKYIHYLLKQKEFRFNASKNMTGASGHKRVPKEYIEDYKFLLPDDIEIQKNIINEIEIIENDIATLKKENELLQIEKENVLKKYL